MDLLLGFNMIYLLALATYRPLGVIRAQALAASEVLIFPRSVYEKCFAIECLEATVHQVHQTVWACIQFRFS